MHAEVQHGGGKNQRGGHALLKKFLVVDGTIKCQQFCFFHGGIPQLFFLCCGLRRGEVLLGGNGGATGGADEVDVIISFTVIIDVR